MVLHDATKVGDGAVKPAGLEQRLAAPETGRSRQRAVGKTIEKLLKQRDCAVKILQTKLADPQTIRCPFQQLVGHVVGLVRLSAKRAKPFGGLGILLRLRLELGELQQRVIAQRTGFTARQDLAVRRRRFVRPIQFAQTPRLLVPQGRQQRGLKVGPMFPLDALDFGEGRGMFALPGQRDRALRRRLPHTLVGAMVANQRRQDRGRLLIVLRGHQGLALLEQGFSRPLRSRLSTGSPLEI